jgi:hypothetical protein
MLSVSKHEIPRRIRIIAVLLCAAALIGCTSNAARVSQGIDDKTYSVSDVGKSGVPQLSAVQKSELAKILKPLPSWKRKRVRFVFSGNEGGPKTSFYILDRERQTVTGGGVQTYRVLNGPCNMFYDPVSDYAFIGTSCGIDADVTG